jgi:hypothetical protein
VEAHRNVGRHSLDAPDQAVDDVVERVPDARTEARLEDAELDGDVPLDRELVVRHGLEETVEVGEQRLLIRPLEPGPDPRRRPRR